MNNLKIALLGSGKTGSKVAELLQQNPPTIFDSKNRPTLENLQGHDVLISFLPGGPFLEYLPLLIESKIPVVSGSTGLEWPSDLDANLKSNNVTWIWANNFSLGMNLVQQMIQTLSKAEKLFDKYTVDIHETHHIKKVDAPSGTAIKWENWIGEKAQISSERVGDVIGIHELTLKTETEKISIKHDALDRKIFAQGALWSAEKIINDPNIEKGLLKFEDLALKELL